jgi:hypothetical protein
VFAYGLHGLLHGLNTHVVCTCRPLWWCCAVVSRQVSAGKGSDGNRDSFPATTLTACAVCMSLHLHACVRVGPACRYEDVKRQLVKTPLADCPPNVVVGSYRFSYNFTEYHAELSCHVSPAGTKRQLAEAHLPPPPAFQVFWC